MAKSTINIPQFQGQQQVNRKIDPSAGDVLAFDSNKKLVARTGPGTAGNVITSPAIQGTAGTGFVIAKQVPFVEDATSVTHTATIPIPAGAELIDIIVDNAVLWTDASATLKIGDTADDDGYFIGVELDATDLLVGEQLRMSQSTLWGGKEGAYLVAATGRRGPTSANFGGHYTAGSNILATISVTTPSGTAGRTFVTVLYATGDIVSPVLA